MIDEMREFGDELETQDNKKKKKTVKFEPIGFEDEKGKVSTQEPQKQVSFEPVGYEDEKGNVAMPKSALGRTMTRIEQRKQVQLPAPQKQATWEEVEKQYTDLDSNSQEFKRMDREAKKRLPSYEYDRLSRRKAGSWTDDDEKKYSSDRQNEYLTKSRDVRRKKAAGEKLSSDDTQFETILNKNREETRKRVLDSRIANREELRKQGKTDEEINKALPIRPKAGLIGGEDSVKRLQEAGVGAGMVSADGEKVGNANVIAGFSTKALLDYDDLKGLSGDAAREAAVKKVSGYLGFNDEEQNEIVASGKEIFGGTGEFWIDKSTGKPVEDPEDLIDTGNYIGDDQKTFFEYSDDNAVTAKIGLLGRLVKEQTGKFDPKLVKQYWEGLQKFEEKKSNKELDESLKEILSGSREQGVLEAVANGLRSVFMPMKDNEESQDTDNFFNEITGYKGRQQDIGLLTEAGAKTEKGKEVEKIAKQLLAIQNYQRNSKTQALLNEVSKIPDTRWLAMSSPILYMALPEEAKKYIPTTQKIAQGVGTLAPALVPYVGLPLSLAMVDKQMQDAAPDDYNTIMLTSVLTMGAGRGLNAIRGTIGSTAVGAGQTALGGIQTGVNYSVNWANYQNEDGSTNYGSLFQDLIIDIAQSGFDVIETAKGVKNKFGTAQPSQMFNMVVRNGDTGSFGMFVKNPDSGVLEFRNVKETEVAKWKAAQDEAKRQYIIQDVNPITFDNLISKGSESTRQAFNNLIWGTPNPARDAQSILERTGGMIAVDDFTETFKAVRDNKSAKVSQTTADPSRSVAVLRLLAEDSAPLNINTNIMQGDGQAIAVIKSLQDEGMVKVSPTGQVSITSEGRNQYVRLTEGIESFNATIAKTKDTFGDGKNFSYAESEAYLNKGRVEGEAVRTFKDHSSDRLTINDITTMSVKQREELAMAVARDDGQFDSSTGVFTGKNFKEEEAPTPKIPDSEPAKEPAKSEAPVRDSIREPASLPEKVNKVKNTALKDYSFSPLGEKEILPDSNTIVLKEKSTGKVDVFEKTQYGTYKSGDVMSSFTRTALQEKVRAGDFEVGRKIEARENSNIGDLYWSERPFSKPEPEVARVDLNSEEGKRIAAEQEEFFSAPKTTEQKIFRDLFNQKNPDTSSIAKKYGMPESQIAKIYISELENYKKTEGEQKTLFAVRDTIKDDDDFLLSPELIQKEKETWEKRNGEITVDAKTKIDLRDKNWTTNAQEHYVLSNADSARAYINHRMADTLRSLDYMSYTGGNAGETMPNVKRQVIADKINAVLNAEDGDDIFSLTRGRWEANGLTTKMKSFADALEAAKGQAFEVVRVSPELDKNYIKFRTNSTHERVHKILQKNGSAILLRDMYPIDNLFFGTPEGAKFRQLVSQSRYKGIEDSSNVMAHEILAMGTNKDTIGMLGVKTPEDAALYANLYVKVLDALAKDHSEDVLNVVKSYQDPKIRELVNKVQANEERIRQNQLRDTGNRPDNTQGTRPGSSGEDSPRAFRIKPDQWEGSGIKRTRYRRLTPDGNPFSLTGISGAEKRRRIAEGASPTLNFYVEKPDGTFVYERDLVNTKLLPYTIEGEFNLVDIASDREAWNAYNNLKFPEFQKWAEERGFDGFFSSGWNLPDVIKYRMSLFDNDAVRSKLAPQELAIRSEQSDIGFYSAITEAVMGDKVPEKAKAKDYLNILRQSPGVKRDELEWSGMSDFLSEDRQLTKDELIKFAQDNRVVVQEIKYKQSETKWADYEGLFTGGKKENDVEIVLTVPSFSKGFTKYAPEENQEYISSHWDDVTNPVVHIRGNGRISIDGKKTFLIDEIQSDLHQEGREKGYRTGKPEEVFDPELQEWVSENIYGDGPVPDAPFKENWHELGFKKALRYAVENGFEQIAWTTGIQQIDRNQTTLRKSVDKISYSTNKVDKVAASNRLKEISGEVRSLNNKIDFEKNRATNEFKKTFGTPDNWGEPLNNYLKSDHNIKLLEESKKALLDERQGLLEDTDSQLQVGYVSITTTKNKQDSTYKIPITGVIKIAGRDISLDNLLGKKMAEEIRAKGEGSFEGEGLSIGGEMHKLLYDQKLPSFAKKYGKKWGAEVNDTFLSTGPDVDAIRAEELRQEQAKEFVNIDEKDYEKTQKFHSMTITPAMRESILEGQTLFMKGEDETEFKQRVAAEMEQEPDSIKQDRLMKSYYSTPPNKANVKQIENIIRKGNFSAFTAIKDGDTSNMENLKRDLESMSYSFIETDGVYAGQNERSFIVYYPDEQSSRIIQYLSNKYNQESALHASGGKYRIEFADGSFLASDKLNLNRTEVTKTGLKFQQEYSALKGKKVDVAARPNMKTLPEKLMKELAQAHINAKHSPDDPAVKKSYDALIKETNEQFDYISKSGLKIEAWDEKGEPYKSSKEMIADIESGHYYYLKTDTEYGTGQQEMFSPMLADSGKQDSNGRNLPANDVFRIVHDLMGHSGNRWQFGIRGEFNAFATHAELYSKEAFPAMMSETLMQNAVVADKNYKLEDGKYTLNKDQKDIEFADQKVIIPSPELIKKVKASIDEQLKAATTYTEDGTYMQLSDGRLNFNIEFDWNDKQPAPQNYSLKGAELKFNTRQKYKDTTILTPEDIRRIYTGEYSMPSNEVYDQTGQKIGVADIDEEGRQYIKFDIPRRQKDGVVFLTNGVAQDGKQKYFLSKQKRDAVGATGLWQQLVKDLHPGLEPIEKPISSAPLEDREAYNIKRSERWTNHIKQILSQWKVSDDNDFGRHWYSEKAEDFASRVGRDIKDVNNDVVKAWLFLTTAATSPNTSVPINTKFSMNAIASLVRFYETGKLMIPKFQYHNDGSLMLKDDGSKKMLGLGSYQLEKVEMLGRGYVPAESVEGFTLFLNGTEVVTAGDILDNPLPKSSNAARYVYSPTADNMMKKYGQLQGIMNFLLSPGLDNKKFNKAVDIFGDKLGAFMSNLMGLTQIPTIDTWMNRYFRGLTGDAIEVKRDKKGRVTSIKDNSMKFDEAEGDFFRGAVQKAVEDWNKENNETLTPADAQAIIWTQVKTLFNDLVKMESENVDFAEAYDQIVNRISPQQGLFGDPARVSEIPNAETNPSLISDANNMAPQVKEWAQGDLSKDYNSRYFIEKRDDLSFAVKSETGEPKTSKDIDLSDEALANADFDAWVNVASRLLGNAAISDGELQKIKQLSDDKDVDGLFSYVSGLNKMTIAELIAGVFRVNPLVGVKNIGRNTLSNQLHQVANEVAKVPSFIADLGLLQANKVLGGENKDRSILFPSIDSNAKAIWGAVTQGLKEAGTVLKHGSNNVTFEHPSLFRDRTTGHLLLRPLEIYMKYGFRLQEAADRPFKTQACYRAMDEIVKLKAKNLGISKEEAREQLSVEDVDKAVDTALYLTFQDSNKIASSYYKMRDGLSPFARAVLDFGVPYVKTPLNVVSVMLDYSGIYPAIKGANNLFGHTEWKNLKETIKNVLDNPDDRQAISYGMGRSLVGWSTMYVGYKLGIAGVLSSFLQKDDRKEREEETAKGGGFGRIKVGDLSFDISSLTPVSFYLLAGAAFADEQKENEAAMNKALDDNNEAAILAARKQNPNVAAVFRILNNLALSTPVLGTILRTAEDNQKREKGGSLDLSSLVGANRVVPAIVGETAKTIDRKERQIDYDNKIVDTIKSNIPVVRESLPIKYDMLGREIEAPIGFDPLKTQTLKKDSVLEELDKYDIVISDSTKGTSVQRNEAKAKKGQRLEPYLKEAIESSQYQEADDKTRKKILAQTISYISREVGREKKDKDLSSSEEKHNLNVMRERELFKQKMLEDPYQFSKDRVIEDKKVLSNIQKAGISELTFRQMYIDIPDFEKWVNKNFLHNLTVTDDMSQAEAERNLKEFQDDPEYVIIKWYVSQKEYEARSNRIAKRKEELVKAGKTEEEIKKILASDAAKFGWSNRRNKLTKFEMKRADRFRDKMIPGQRQSENIEDRRK